MIGHFADADAEARFRAAYAEGMARMPPPSSTAMIPTEFGQVHVHRFGSAPGTPLVLLPAGAGRVTEPDRFCVRVLALAEDRCGVVGDPARGLELPAHPHVELDLGRGGPPTYPADDQLRALHVPTPALIAGRSEIHDGRKAFERARSLLPDVRATR